VSEVLDAKGDPPPLGPIERAAIALQRGLAVVVPTETVYGVAVDPFAEGATDQLFRLKGRPKTVPVAVMVANARQAEPMVAEIDHEARRLMLHFWPGPLTIVMARRPGLEIDLGVAADTIGLRCPAHPVPRALALLVGPLATTSANRHGEPTPHEAADVATEFTEDVPLILDGGRCDHQPSTVVELDVEGRIEILRPGPITVADLRQATRRSW